MSRRRLLQTLPATLALTWASRRSAFGAPQPGTAQAPPPATSSSGAGPRRAGPIRAVCFDLFTLFDPRGVLNRATELLKDSAEAALLWEAWRTRQFEYSWLRAAAGQYVDFLRVTEHALTYAAALRQLSLSPAMHRRLVDAYMELAPYPDTREQLSALRSRGLKLAPLANYSPTMISRLLNHSALSAWFDDQISTDVARTFKPDPRAYALGPARLRLDRHSIAFSAFGGWDAAGAHWFGFPTFWVNRFNVPAEQLGSGYDTGSTLAELVTFIDAWPR